MRNDGKACNHLSHERASIKQGKLILDGLWSTIMTGFAFGNINVERSKAISVGLKATYLDICKQSAKNIYQIAKNINRPYNWVHDDAKTTGNGFDRRRI